MKSILGIGLYFCATLLLSYYFVEVTITKAIQLAALITMVHILMLLIDKLNMRKKRRKERSFPE
ncbi:hypothetical protein EV294_1243 [Paenibacillus sp. BK033]|uniref:hypothetical protein n=1 Tax=Paenibacillus sp. BK033 TaxID=2512133 RepID=UPI0010430889|nr:hypothetical protein [Paenibacillus sp. BK033]TCM85698.1 hypothetical protein EV294_1243 [Paenibacillus sp. BK033]